MHPSPNTLLEAALWATYVFLKKHTTKIHLTDDSCVNQYGFNLESTLIENISAFPDTVIWGCILAFLEPIWHIWHHWYTRCNLKTYAVSCILAFLEPIWHIWHHWYTRCNLKTYAVRFSMWQVIFRPNFRLIGQHLVLVLADLHLFLAIFRTIFCWKKFWSDM